MILRLLLTPDIAATKPATTKIIKEWGQTTVVFAGDPSARKTGLHCIVEDTEENIINWLRPFDGFVKGVGINPQMEEFEIVHIKNRII